MRGTGKAIHAAMTAAAVRVYRDIKSHIRRIVRGDHTAGAIRQHGFGQVLDDLVVIPAVIGLLEAERIESTWNIRRGAPALEGLMAKEIAGHAPNFTRQLDARKSSSRQRQLLYKRSRCNL